MITQYNFKFKGSFNLNVLKKGENYCFDESQFRRKRDVNFIVFSAPDYPKSKPRVLCSGY